MDDRTRDHYLARWMIARGLCQPTQLTAVAAQAPDLVAGLMACGLLNDALLSQFFAELQSRIGSWTPPTSPSQDARRKAAALPAPGQRIAGYELLGELGRGGMGAVYKVKRLEDGAILALKVMLSGGEATEDDRERFRREVAALRRLEHPCIVGVYDAGCADRFDFYVMDLLEGATSITRFAEQRELSLWQAVGLLASQAEALQHAHEAGIIHRDVKPGNLVVDEGGRPWVVDFGLARDIDRKTRLTQSGAVLGTPSYMAPEQCVESSAVDARADVYALGAVLYELMTGRKPFESDSLTTLLAEILNRPPDRPSSIAERVDPRLEAVCMKALEKSPDRRYRDAGAFAEDLRRALAGEPVEALRGRRWMRALAALGVGVALALAGAGTWLATRPGSRIVTREQLTTRARRLEAQAEAAAQRLSAPGGFDLGPLEEALSLPRGVELEGGAAPDAWRALQGRLALLRAELALRQGEPGRAAAGLEEAAATLEPLQQGALLRPLRCLLELRGDIPCDDPEALLQRLGHAIIASEGRGDLLLARAELYARRGDAEPGLEDLEGADRRGFRDRRLRARLLSLKGDDAAVAELFQGEDALAPTPADIPLIAKAVGRELELWEVQEAVALIARVLEAVPDSERWEPLVAVIWGWLMKVTEKGQWEAYGDGQRIAALAPLFEMLEHRLQRRGMPVGLPEQLFALSINVHTIKGEVAEEASFDLCRWACVWGPGRFEHWETLLSESYLEPEDPPEVYQDILDRVELALASATTEEQRLTLGWMLLRAFYNARRPERGLELIAPPSEEVQARAPVAAVRCLYRAARCARALNQPERAISWLEQAARTPGVESREIFSELGDLYAEAGRIEDAVEARLTAAALLRGNSALSKWSYLTQRLADGLGAVSGLRERYLSVLEAQRARPELGIIWQLADRIRLGELDEARALARAEAAQTPRESFRRTLTQLADAAELEPGAWRSWLTTMLEAL